MFRRHLLAQSLMRTIMIELVPEPVEPRLLRRRVPRRRTRRLRLQCRMHPLVPSVLLRMPGRDPLQPDAKLQPVHRERAQTPRAERCERGAVVAAHRMRQTVFGKQRINRRANRLTAFRHDLERKDVAAVRIGHRQRVAAFSVRRAEPAFEVDAPGVVRRVDRSKRLRWRHRMPAPARRTHQARPLQDVRHRARRRPLSLRIAPAQQLQ